ncbi:unnamed protein product [Caenorhabditis bovis]|nr:unnamed protein product [Caenorhabditis bovis]
MKADGGIAWMQNLSQQQINDYIKERVNKFCTADTKQCNKMTTDLIDIADIIDDDNSEHTPEVLCEFTYFCN